jgi:hypothetical protein
VHVIDTDQAIKAACNAENLQQAIGVGARRIGHQPALARKHRQLTPQARSRGHKFVQVAIRVGCAQKLCGVDSVMAHKAKQSSPVAVPIGHPQRTRRLGGEI